MIFLILLSFIHGGWGGGGNVKINNIVANVLIILKRCTQSHPEDIGYEYHIEIT